MFEALLSLLMGLTPWYGDVEAEKARETRLRVVATSIAAAAKTRQEAVLLVTMGEFESHYALHIHEGRCGEHPKSRKGECDYGLAGSPWQLLRGKWNHSAWPGYIGVGAEPTGRAAKAALKPLRFGLRCGYDGRGRYNHQRALEGAFSVAARGGCGWPGAKKRVARYHQLMRRYGR